jgi:AcrR family transcriptional regulator
LSIPWGMGEWITMARKGTGAKRLDEPTLTAADWVEGALQLIAEAGLGALKVEALAARLGVTKGSFYWHFKGRSELLASALNRWEHRATTEAIAGLKAVTDARQRLHLMLDAATQPPRSRSLYAALSEAAGDPIVRRALNRVASARIEYLEACYAELGLALPRAKAKGVFAYAAYRGLLQLAHEAPAVLPADWSSYAAVVLEGLGPGPLKKQAKKTRAKRQSRRAGS